MTSAQQLGTGFIAGRRFGSWQRLSPHARRTAGHQAAQGPPPGPGAVQKGRQVPGIYPQPGGPVGSEAPPFKLPKARRLTIDCLFQGVGKTTAAGAQACKDNDLSGRRGRFGPVHRAGRRRVRVPPRSTTLKDPRGR